MTRDQAIQILLQVASQDNLWEAACESILKLEEQDLYPSIYDAFEALGVSKEEVSRLNGEGFEDFIAQGFQRIRYSYHRDFFGLLGYPEISAVFADIWKMCESHMKNEPHDSLVYGKEPSHWASLLDAPQARCEFLDSLSDVLEREATGDEERGRVVLASKLRKAIQLIRSDAFWAEVGKRR